MPKSKSEKPSRTSQRNDGDLCNETEKRRTYAFMYMIPPRKDGDSTRPYGPHCLRDGQASTHIQSILSQRGYESGQTPIINFPGDPETETPAGHFDHSFLTKNDCLVMTTRPPMHDLEEPTIKPPIKRSYTKLEGLVLGLLGRYFRYCSRVQVHLTRDVAHSSPAPVGERSSAQFRQRGGPWCSEYSPQGISWRRPQVETTTFVYLVNEPEIWPGGPSLVLAFGLGGMTTLGWTRLLQTRFSHLVGVPGFVMAQIVVKESPQVFYDLSFVDTWEVELLTGSSPVRVTPQPINSGAKAGGTFGEVIPEYP